MEPLYLIASQSLHRPLNRRRYLCAMPGDEVHLFVLRAIKDDPTMLVFLML
jgi:hypothetical protein